MSEIQKRIPSISIESQEIIRRLEKMAVGDFVSYDELSQLAMGDVRKEKRFALQTARDHLMIHKGAIIECVVNEGVKRLSDAEINKLGEATVAKIHRASHRGLQKLACADYEKLKLSDRIEHNARFSALGALHHITKPSQMKRLQGAVEKTQCRLQLQETLDAFDRDDRADRFPPKLQIVKNG
jgi:hypothetical protein